MTQDLDALEGALLAKRAALIDPKPDTDHLGHWRPVVLQNRRKRGAIDAALHRLAIARHEQGGPMPDGCSDRDCSFCRERKLYRNPFAAVDEQLQAARERWRNP
jgi:hypothetical protein